MSISEESYLRILTKAKSIHTIARPGQIHLYEQENILFEYDAYHAYFVMNSDSVLMLDFDFSEALNAADILIRIINFTNKNEHLLFDIYQTDRGIHAFLVSKFIHYTDEEARQIMCELGCDPLYIAMSSFKGFCVRISPKMKVSPNDFVSRKICEIGHGHCHQEIKNYLKVHDEIIRWCLSELKIVNYETRYVSEIDAVQLDIDREFLSIAKNYFCDLLIKYGLKQMETDFIHPIEYYADEINKSTKYIAYSDDQINVRYDMFGGMWVLEMRDILVVDFDESLNETGNEFLIRAEEYAINNKLTFAVYDTDHGMHLFLISEIVQNTEDMCQKILNDLTPKNSDHINKVLKDGHSSRISPKYLTGKIGIIGEKRIIIGKTEILPCLESILILYETLVNYLRTTNIPFNKVTFNNQVYSAPSEQVIDNVRQIVGNNYLNFYDRIFRSVINVNRYRDLIDNPISRTIEAIKNDAKNLKFNRLFQDILLKGPTYPFVLRYNLRPTHQMFCLMFYDLVMVDWDSQIKKDDVVELIKRFLYSEERRHRSNRITNSRMCFKLYETDNGVHGYLVSHRISHDSDRTILLHLEMCCDYIYTVFSRAQGASVRLSPKIGKENQFVQKEGINGQVYVGDVDNIDPYLDRLTNLIYATQQYIVNKKIKDTEKVRSFVLKQWRNTEKVNISNRNIEWASMY